MGVEDALAEITELTPAMLVRLGENDIKTLEDFAGCVTDDLTGWFETVERKRVRQDGILDGFDISPEEAEALIMSARVKAGWVTQEELDALAAEKRRRKPPRKPKNWPLPKVGRGVGESLGESPEGEALPPRQARLTQMRPCDGTCAWSLPVT